MRTLNKMKEYLGSMHRSMSKEVVKRLVVAIKRMEQDLLFYENNWELFQSPNLDYVDGILIDIEQQRASLHQKSKYSGGSKDILRHPQIINDEQSRQNKKSVSYFEKRQIESV